MSSRPVAAIERASMSVRYQRAELLHLVPMKLYVTRDSVAAGDDVDAPHRLEMEGPAEDDVGAAIAKVLAAGYLPRVSGGKATWSVASNRILGVVAQEWRSAKLIWNPDPSYRGLDTANGKLRLHFNYHAQHDPDLVLEILSDVRLRAPSDGADVQ